MNPGVPTGGIPHPQCETSGDLADTVVSELYPNVTSLSDSRRPAEVWGREVPHKDVWRLHVKVNNLVPVKILQSRGDLSSVCVGEKQV